MDSRGRRRSCHALYDRNITRGTVARSEEDRQTPSDKWDRVLVHPILGWVVLFSIKGGLFYVVQLGGYPMDLIDGAFGWLGEQVEARMAEGDLRALITEGIIGGVGGVVISANSHPVFLHWAHGKHWLFGSCVLHDGSFDVRCGIEW